MCIYKKFIWMDLEMHFNELPYKTYHIEYGDAPGCASIQIFIIIDNETRRYARLYRISPGRFGDAPGSTSLQASGRCSEI